MKIASKDLLQPALDRVKNLLSGFGSSFCVGLDIGLDRLNLVQMELVSGKPCIRGIASIPFACSREELFTQPQTLRDLLRQAYAKQPFKGKRVVSCLPADQIKIITIHYKLKDDQSDEMAIVFELRERFKSELDNMVVDFMTLRQEDSDSTKREAIVALAPRETVMTYLQLLANAGLVVEALDIGPAALARLVRHTGAIHSQDFPKEPNVLLINFGAESSFLTVIWGRRLILDRTVEFSEKRLFDRLNRVLEMPEEVAMRLMYEKNIDQSSQSNISSETYQMVAEVLKPDINPLLQEINKTLVYMASKTRGKSMDKIYLAGRVARYSDIVESLNAQLNVPVEVLDPVAIFAAKKNIALQDDVGTIAGMAMTAGLALRGIPEHG